MKPRTPPRRYTPRLEALEERRLLSVYTVDRLPDFNQGTGLFGDLRYCVTQAQAGDTIRFSVQGTLSLRSPLPDLTRDVRIEGPGPGVLTVRRQIGGNYRVFTVAPGATVAISGLTIANGDVGPGSGGGLANAGTLTLSTSTVSGNFARVGGGILNTGTLTIANSTLSGNVATGAGPVSGGGVANTGTLAVFNSTVSGNRATAGKGDSSGGGLANTGAGVLTVVGGTITANVALAGKGTPSAGGLAAGGTVHLRNTVVAGNTGGGQPDLTGTLATSGFNLIGNSTGGSGFQGSDLLNVVPQLGPLANNGGPTFTHALLPGSPALNRGHPKSDPAGFDQRGAGFARIAGGRIDIGAFEVQGMGYGGGLWAPDPVRPVHDSASDAHDVLGLAMDRRRAAAEQDDLGHDLPPVTALCLQGQVDAGPPEQPRIEAVLQGDVDQPGDFDV